jgi:ATP-dependent Clp protease ATP-binding subunit ClpC
VFEHFTDEARHVLVLAQEEARLLERSSVGTEHLLLGLIREADGAAAKALDSLGITLESARERVKEGTRDLERAPRGSPPFTREAKRVLIELSPREASQLGHGYIGTEHLLLGMLHESDSMADHVLISLGADIADVRERVRRFMPGQE